MNEVYVVDFGFSCKGEIATGAATISVGPFFGLNDVCPKEGRDIYILLCYFYAQRAWRLAASAKLLGWVRHLLAVPKVLEHLETYGTDRTEYIYLLLNNREFNSKQCSAAEVLGQLAAMWPSVVVTST